MKSDPPITREQLAQAFRSAQERHEKAGAEMRAAAERSTSALQELQALAVLARSYGYDDLTPQPQAPTTSEVLITRRRVGFDLRDIPKDSILGAIVQHFLRHPEVASPSEVADAIKRDTGRDIAGPAITTTKLRHAHLFRNVESEKRGGFRLRHSIADRFRYQLELPELNPERSTSAKKEDEKNRGP